MDPIKVLVVDDSVFMRSTISKIISCDEILVIDTASNGRDAVEKAARLNPDVITMDIEMPIMNGLEALKIIMENHPIPTLMVSTLTGEGAEATIEALSIGAIDFITKKPAFTEMHSMKDDLINKILTIGRSNQIRNQLRRRSQLMQMKKAMKKDEVTDSVAKAMTQKLAEKAKQKPANIVLAPDRHRPKAKDIDIIAIGISTGGPVALFELISRLPATIPVPIVIAQHMPPYFTRTLAERLNAGSELNVKEAADGDKLLPGWVYLAQGGRQMRVTRKSTLLINDDPIDELYKPSVNIMISSVAEVYKAGGIGIIMTGMGHDGREGIKKLNQAGGYAISQDVESCVVPGMPKSIIEAQLAHEIHSLGEMPNAICSFFGLTAIERR